MSKAEQLYKNDGSKTPISPIIDNPDESLVDNTVNGTKLIDDSVNINKLNPSTRKIINDSYTEVGKKQDKLNPNQLVAVNSGITSAKVSTYDNYAITKQDKLESKVNIKTINNQSILGSGNIEIQSITGASGVQLSAPASATNGTLSSGQLVTLQESDSNYIIFNNEIYRLEDKSHTADTYTYIHVGYENNKHYIKSISITISTLAWVLNISTISDSKASGGAITVVDNLPNANKLEYDKHNLYFNSNELYYLTETKTNNYKFELTDFSIKEYLDAGYNGKGSIFKYKNYLVVAPFIETYYYMIDINTKEVKTYNLPQNIYSSYVFNDYLYVSSSIFYRVKLGTEDFENLFTISSDLINNGSLKYIDINNDLYIITSMPHLGKHYIYKVDFINKTLIKIVDDLPCLMSNPFFNDYTNLTKYNNRVYIRRGYDLLELDVTTGTCSSFIFSKELLYQANNQVLVGDYMYFFKNAQYTVTRINMKTKAVEDTGIHLPTDLAKYFQSFNFDGTIYIVSSADNNKLIKGVSEINYSYNKINSTEVK